MAQGYLSPAFQEFLINGEAHDKMLSLSSIAQVQGLNLSSALKHRSAIGWNNSAYFGTNSCHTLTVGHKCCILIYHY